MREKMLKIADRLSKRADDFIEPVDYEMSEAYKTQSITIAATLKEIAYQIRAELSAPDDG